MDDETETSAGEADDRLHPAPERRALPPLSNAEREFWRRAVAVERGRQGVRRALTDPRNP